MNTFYAYEHTTEPIEFRRSIFIIESETRRAVHVCWLIVGMEGAAAEIKYNLNAFEIVSSIQTWVWLLISDKKIELERDRSFTLELFTKTQMGQRNRYGIR